MREDCCGRIPHDPRCPYAEPPLIRGYCKQCGEWLTQDYEYFKDDEGNEFCSRECGVKYHDINSYCWSDWN